LRAFTTQINSQFLTNDNETILMNYLIAIIKNLRVFLNALQTGKATKFETGANQYSELEQNVFIGAERL